MQNAKPFNLKAFGKNVQKDFDRNFDFGCFSFWVIEAWHSLDASPSRIVWRLGMTTANQCIGFNALDLAFSNSAIYVFGGMGIS